MSKVISFRLNEENPRETQAYKVLMAWYEKGHSIRYTITKALLKLDESRTESVLNTEFVEINETLRQVRQLLEQIGKMDNSSKKSQDNGTACSGLTDNFVASIKKAAKPGMKLDRPG